MKLLVLLAALATLQVALSPSALGADAKGPDAKGPDAKRLYGARCSACHGSKGEGGSGVSFKKKMQHSSMKNIAHVIKAGIPGTAMPPSADLSDKQATELAAYVLQLHRAR